MTPDQQAKLEQAANTAMKTISPMLRNGVGPETKVYQWAKDAIIEAIAAQRAAVLEEVIPLMTKLQETNDEAVTSSDRYWVKVGIADILKKLQEQRP